MEYVLTAMGILASIYGFWQSYKNQEELVGIIANIPAKTQEEFVKESIVNLTQGRTGELLNIRQELIHRGEIALAEQIDEIIDVRFRLSEESLCILTSYLNSNKFYEDLKNIK